MQEDFAIVSLFLLCIASIKLYKERRYLNIFIVVILLPFIPVGANFTEIIIPGSVNYIVMHYQYVLVIPFFISIAEHIDLKGQTVHLFKATIYITCCLAAWTYVISANATYTCYKLSYNHINFETSLVLSEIYKLQDYVPSETAIIFAGFPNADELVEEINTYKYAIHYTDNPVFWEDINGASHNRQNYLMNYFGVDGKELNREMYAAIINSDEFKEMPIWPMEGSVKMFDGTAVVKFTAYPPAL